MDLYIIKMTVNTNSDDKLQIDLSICFYFTLVQEVCMRKKCEKKHVVDNISIHEAHTVHGRSVLQRFHAV